MTKTSAVKDRSTKEVSTSSDSSRQVLAVIVTFNPDLSALSNLVSVLKSQECEILIVDNGSSNQVNIIDAGFDVNLICNVENLGLGAAHNQGIDFCEQAGCPYLLILDQDSVPLDSMVQKLIVVHQEKSKEAKVSAVGACYLNSQNNSESFFVRFGWLKFQREYALRPIVPADFLISSGSLFSIDTLHLVGRMDESLFIDHVDTEWFLRAASKGYQAFGASEARMSHGLGEQTHRVKVGGRERNVPQHKPFRYYYIFRNSVCLYRRRYASSLWKWNDLQRLAMIFVMFGLLRTPRWANLKMMFLGAWHGFSGKSGRTDFSEPHN
ncbi:glycosyltransferase family 2 protein [Arenicella sp. 4NH20-0111]|uniref:glycosyltransferase family 2 protein n=1 Tax=Arenicella sp. 4NH20-0111 TaxID=3127648 RepID=UPI00333E8CB2